MPNVSAGLQNPFVRAVLASSSARGHASPFAPRSGSVSDDDMFQQTAPRTSDQGPAIDAPRATPAGYGDSDSSGLYGGTVTPIARIPTPGPHSSNHDPDEWQDPNRPMDNMNTHPTWSYYRRDDRPPYLNFGYWKTDEPDWEYSTDGGKNWHDVEPGRENFDYGLAPPIFSNGNDNPSGYIFQKKRPPGV